MGSSVRSPFAKDGLGEKLRIVVHDFSGHPGQLQLSRELARRGHTVEHQYCKSYTTGKGATSRFVSDPESFSIRSIALPGEFARYSPLRRVVQEFRYGWLATRAVSEARPDVVILSNVPLIPLTIISAAFRARRLPYIFWWQDVYSEAIGAAAKKRLGVIGTAVAWLANALERSVARHAAAIVAITEAFLDRLDSWGIDPRMATVIPNWGALDEVSPQPRKNPWSSSHGLDDVTVVMYAGTLGLKHDPAVIADLARNVRDDCRVVVVSQGQGREWLERNCGANDKLILLDYQPYEQLSEMLATGDVLLAILEDDASRYSVPSKVLNYLCAGRPVFAILPSDNSVAKTIQTARAGVVAPVKGSGDPSAALNQLLQDLPLREAMAANARIYAEQAFELTAIGDGFEAVINRSAGIPLPTGPIMMETLQRRGQGGDST